MEANYCLGFEGHILHCEQVQTEMFYHRFTAGKKIDSCSSLNYSYSVDMLLTWMPSSNTVSSEYKLEVSLQSGCEAVSSVYNDDPCCLITLVGLQNFSLQHTIQLLNLKI